MNKKKLFLTLALIFFGAMLYIGYDISSRTTFPGSNPQIQERLFNKDTTKSDTVELDSAPTSGY